MKSLYIKSLSIEENAVKAIINIGGVDEVITTTISERYIKNVVIDRIDAYAWGLLGYAMNINADIISEIPISEQLYYNLSYHYIPTLAKARKEFNHIRIKAPLIKEIESTCELIGTGISCGVDSLYTIKTHTSEVFPQSHRINTLAFFNVGSSMKGGDILRTPLVQGRLELAEKFAMEYNYNFIFIESDIHMFIDRHIGYDHVQNHTFMMLFCTYHLQSIIGKYYYSSGYSYDKFHFGKDLASYDLLTFAMASIGHLQYYSTGAENNRLEKTKELIDYEPAQKYLNVCVENVENDSTCFKCTRTILALDGLQALDKFKKVFNIEIYRKKRFYYLKELYTGTKFKNDGFMKEIYPLFKDEFTFKLKVSIFLSIIKNRIGIK